MFIGNTPLELPSDVRSLLDLASHLPGLASGHRSPSDGVPDRRLVHLVPGISMVGLVAASSFLEHFRLREGVSSICSAQPDPQPRDRMVTREPACGNLEQIHSGRHTNR